MDPVASWVLSTLLTVALGVIAFFLVRTYNRLEKVEQTGIQGRNDLMTVIEKGNLELRQGLASVREKLAEHQGAIQALGRESEQRARFADERHERYLTDHRAMQDEMKELAKALFDRRYPGRRNHE